MLAGSPLRAHPARTNSSFYNLKRLGLSWKWTLTFKSEQSAALSGWGGVSVCLCECVSMSDLAVSRMVPASCSGVNPGDAQGTPCAAGCGTRVGTCR